MVMRTLATLHRWWGVAFCLLFAMWFASGLVMHFAPYPARSERPPLLGIDTSGAETIDYDQWTVSGDFDSDRPLMRIAPQDDAGTEIYISAASGRIVLTTTRNQRLLNYVGSIPHWLYVTELRRHPRVWADLMRWLSLLATVGAALGVLLGIVRLRAGPLFRGVQRWHHVGGLIVAPFLLSWVFSGFLSMDDGLLPHAEILFRTLHRLDFPPLSAHPRLRAAAIVALCLFGFAFSLTGATLAWRRVTNAASAAE
jgi:PepSY-associated TM region